MESQTHEKDCPVVSPGWAATIPPYCTCKKRVFADAGTTPNYCPNCGHKL